MEESKTKGLLLNSGHSFTMVRSQYMVIDNIKSSYLFTWKACSHTMAEANKTYGH